MGNDGTCELGSGGVVRTWTVLGQEAQAEPVPVMVLMFVSL